MPLPGDPWSDADVARLAELDRADARVQADRVEILARMAAMTSARELGWAGEAPYDSLVMEVGGTSRIGQQAAGNRLRDAERLHDRLPGTLAGLRDGRLFWPQPTRHLPARSWPPATPVPLT